MAQENYKREKLIKTAAEIIHCDMEAFDVPRDDFGPNIPKEYIEEVLAKAKDEYLRFIVKNHIAKYINKHYAEEYSKLRKGERE